MTKKVDVLGVGISQINLSEASNLIRDFLVGDKQQKIVTVNPEFIVAAQKRQDFKEFLNNADLATCDGVGLVWAANFLKKEKLIRVTGVDLVENILHNKIPGTKVFLVGSDDEVIKNLRLDYPKVIVGGLSGGQLDQNDYLLENNETVLAEINNTGANLILVALGQVKQEMWIKNNLAKLLNVNVAIGVGGALDYISGKVLRAPRGWRRLGLEWLYRLIRQPQRLGRIFTAVIVFPILAIKEKFKK